MARAIIFSKLGDGGTISIQGTVNGRIFAKDAVADLDDVLVPAAPGRSAITLEESLTAYSHLYEPYTVPSESPRSSRRSKREDWAEPQE